VGILLYMSEAARHRCAYIISLWREGLWGRWLGTAYFLAGLFIFIRDDWWRPADDSRWKLVAMIPHFTWEQWTLGALAIGVIWIFEASYRVKKRLERRLAELEGIRSSPLEIGFDPSNPSHRFWSMESRTNPNRADESVPYWEYRVEIKNVSPQTVRNVRVVKEHLGAMPIRPASMPFDLTKKELHDINPGCSALIPIAQWPHPIIQAGMLAGPSALEHGPIQVNASGDDVLPTKRTFKFDYQRTPMIYE